MTVTFLKFYQMNVPDRIQGVRERSIEELFSIINEESLKEDWEIMQHQIYISHVGYSGSHYGVSVLFKKRS